MTSGIMLWPWYVFQKLYANLMANKSIIRSRNKCNSYAWSWVIKQKSIYMYTGICNYNRKILLVLQIHVHVFIFQGKDRGREGKGDFFNPAKNTFWYQKVKCFRRVQSPQLIQKHRDSSRHIEKHNMTTFVLIWIWNLHWPPSVRFDRT